jgi:hypothetical protein
VNYFVKQTMHINVTISKELGLKVKTKELQVISCTDREGKFTAMSQPFFQTLATVPFYQGSIVIMKLCFYFMVLRPPQPSLSAILSSKNITCVKVNFRGGPYGYHKLKN